MPFPETITLDAGLSRGSSITGALYDSASAKYFNLLRDGTNLVMFSSSDGATWAQAGGLGPTYDPILAGGAAYTVNYLGNVWVVYVDAGGFLAVTYFDVTADDWSGHVVASGFDGQPLQIALLQVSGTKLVIFGTPITGVPDVGSHAVYSIFDFSNDAISDWVNVGLAGLLGTYPSSFPIGIAAGTSGRVHLIGCTPDDILATDHLWQQTIYPLTNTLIAVDEFSTTSENDDVTLFPVCMLAGGLVAVRVSIGGPDGPYTYLVGASADTIVFAPVAGPALPNVNCEAVGLVSNGAGGRVFVMDPTTAPLTPEYFSCSFDGVTFGAFTSIGSSATLAGFPGPCLSVGNSLTNGYYFMTWRGSVFFWSFFAPVIIAPVVGVLAGGLASTPVDIYGTLLGRKRFKDC